MVAESWDDERFLTALQQARRARQAVPPAFAEAGKNTFAWHSIDAELAQLTYDSTRHTGRVPTARAEGASIRALTFSSVHLTIELEVTRDSLLCQVVPAQPAIIEVQARTGAATRVNADGIGCFSIHPIPRGLFRLRCQTAAGIDVLTGWITP